MHMLQRLYRSVSNEEEMNEQNMEMPRKVWIRDMTASVEIMVRCYYNSQDCSNAPWQKPSKGDIQLEEPVSTEWESVSF